MHMNFIIKNISFHFTDLGYYMDYNILGFINTGYFTSSNMPDGIKNATHNTFSNFRKKKLKLKYPAFSGNG
jgi:hypothetical protein